MFYPREEETTYLVIITNLANEKAHLVVCISTYVFATTAIYGEKGNTP